MAARRLVEWSAANKEPTSVDGISRKVAGRYVGHLIGAGTDPATGNKALGGLANYWSWLAERGHVPGENPWRGQRIPKDRAGPKAEDGGGNKRPFTDDEVVTLMKGLAADKPGGLRLAMLDMAKAAALTGGRIGELAELRVRHLDTAAWTVTQRFPNNPPA